MDFSAAREKIIELQVELAKDKPGSKDPKIEALVIALMRTRTALEKLMT